MLSGKGLLVSLPAQELQHFSPSGSLFALDELRKFALSDELRSALEISAAVCSKRRAPLVLVTRPEMFTHGASLAWLRKRLGGIQDHLVISDGSAIRPVPEMRNHLFLYRHGHVGNRGAFARLSSQVPELIATLHSQANTTVSVRLGSKRHTPSPWLLQSQRPAAQRGKVRLYPYVHEASVAASLERMLAARTPHTPRKSFRHLSYLPLSEFAADDGVTLRCIAALLWRAKSLPGSCVLLGAPRIAGASGGEAAALHVAIECARAAGVKSSKSSPPMAFVTQDPAPQAFSKWSASTDLYMPESFAYWRHAPAYYQTFKKLTVFGGADAVERTSFLELLTDALGRRPVWH